MSHISLLSIQNSYNLKIFFKFYLYRIFLTLGQVALNMILQENERNGLCDLKHADPFSFN